MTDGTHATPGVAVGVFGVISLLGVERTRRDTGVANVRLGGETIPVAVPRSSIGVHGTGVPKIGERGSKVGVWGTCIPAVGVPGGNGGLRGVTGTSFSNRCGWDCIICGDVSFVVGEIR